MSVALQIRPRGEPGRPARLVPVATQQDFEHLWLPACEALNLVWVPLFETGIPLAADDIRPVLDELERLKRWFRARSLEDSTAVLPRLEQLIQELSEARPQLDIELFIG